MRKIFFIVIFFIPSILFSQYNWDLGGYIGGANYLGEMGGKEDTRKGFISDIKISQTRWVFGISSRYKLSSLIAAQASISYARIQGSDNLSDNPARYGRNLSFRNDFFELALRAEVSFLNLHDVGNQAKNRVDLSAFAFAGGAMIYHNPKTKFEGEWIALQPLNTEGLSKPYSKFQPTIPLGAGFYFTYNKRHRIGWEFGWRITFTDYLDDVSSVYVDLSDPLAENVANRRNELPMDDPKALGSENYGPGGIRGNPDNNDTYMFTQITYSHAFKGQSSFYRSKYQFVIGAKRKKRKTRAKF